jgi:hypothetical protein
MVEAWGLRSLERQRLMEKLIRIISKLEDEEGEAILFGVVQVLVECLQAKKEKLYNDFLLAKAIAVHGELYNVVFNELLPKIDSFARAPEEADVMVADLLKKILDMALSSVYAELSHIEIMNPRLIFHADAMADVEMPEDE